MCTCSTIVYNAVADVGPMYIHYINIHWASKETYNFLEWCPLKSTTSKYMIFGLMLAIQSSSLPTSKNKEIECAKNEINAFKSQQVQFQNHRNCSLSTAQTFGHFSSYSFKFNSGIRNHVHNRFAVIEGIYLIFGIFNFFVFWRG